MMQRKDALAAAASALRQTALDPDAIVAHPAWCRARRRLLEAMADAASLVLLAGPAGSGKTLMLRDLADRLRDAGQVVRTRPPLPGSDGHTQFAGVLLLDDADRMEPAALAALLGARGYACVLAVRSPTALPFGAAATLPMVTLGPLDTAGVRGFVDAALSGAGLPRGLANRQALARLHAFSGGLPRLTGALAAGAFAGAAAEQASSVAAAHVDRMAAELGLHEPDRTRTDRRRRPAALALGTAIALAVVGLIGVGSYAGLRLASSGRTTAQPPPRADATGPLGDGQLGADRVAASTTAAPIQGAAPFIARGDAARYALAVPSTPTEPEAALPATASAPAEPARADPAPTEPATTGKQAALPSGMASPGIGAPATTVEGDPGYASIETPPSPPAAMVVRPDPPAGLARVQVAFAAGDPVAARSAAAMVSGLRADGFLVDQAAALVRQPWRPGVHYYFAEDRDAAEAVARRLGGGTSQQGVTRLPPPEPWPPPGTIEIAVPAGHPSPPTAVR